MLLDKGSEPCYRVCMSKLRMGMYVLNNRIVYGYGHGYLLWMPQSVKSFIARIWNNIACLLTDHVVFKIPGKQRACIYCGKEQ